APTDLVNVDAFVRARTRHAKVGRAEHGPARDVAETITGIELPPVGKAVGRTGHQVIPKATFRLAALGFGGVATGRIGSVTGGIEKRVPLDMRPANTGADIRGEPVPGAQIDIGVGQQPPSAEVADVSRDTVRCNTAGSAT